MKILLAHEMFAPDFRGGGEYVMLETARGLISQGLQVEVVTTGDPRIREYEGISTRRLPVHRSTLLLQVPRLARMAREVDLVQTAFYHACLPSVIAGRLARKPVVATVLALFQDVWKETRRWPVGSIYSAWERILLKQDIAAFLFLSEFSMRIGLDLGVDPGKASVISPGIESGLYRSWEPKEDVVLFSGKLDSRKGIDDVLEVARALPHIRFQIKGWGPDAGRIQSRAPANIQFVPYDRNGLPESFGRARIFLMPSRHETFGVALIQAMASGCAIVSSVPLAFDGIRVKAGDRDAMIAGIQKLWSDRELTKQIGRRNIELSREYTWDNYIHKLICLYDDVLRARRDAPSKAIA